MFLLLVSLTANAQSIVGGELDEDHPEVLSLGIALGETWYSACTGTLITPRVVLSAAHCAADYSIDTVVAIGKARFGADTAEPVATISFEGGLVHPDYVPLDGWNISSADLALLELSEDGPARPAELQQPLLPEELDDEPLLSVGYGITSENANDSGVRRAVDLVASDSDEEFIYIKDDEVNFCSGDSGGPQFGYDEDGTLMIWGVHSWGQVGCQGRSAATRVDGYAEWILDYVESVHGTRDLCEASGFYGDGTCDTRCPSDPDCLEDTGGPVAEAHGGCSSAPALPGLAGLGLLVMAAFSRRRRA